MGTLLKMLWEAISGWLPWPQWNIAVAPWVFYPLFALLVVALIVRHALEFRGEHRKAVARGEGRQHVWLTVIFFFVVIGGFGLWFIRS